MTSPVVARCASIEAADGAAVKFPRRLNPGASMLRRVQMQHASRNAFRAAIIVPTQEIETCLALGWRLLDEPHCSGARMLPPKDMREQTTRTLR